MKKLAGRPGSVSGLVLRLGQFSCAAASIGVMVSSSSFASFTAFWYLFCFILIFFASNHLNLLCGCLLI